MILPLPPLKTKTKNLSDTEVSRRVVILHYSNVLVLDGLRTTGLIIRSLLCTPLQKSGVFQPRSTCKAHPFVGSSRNSRNSKMLGSDRHHGKEEIKKEIYISGTHQIIMMTASDSLPFHASTKLGLRC